jgi:uncharacterized protein YggE
MGRVRIAMAAAVATAGGLAAAGMLGVASAEAPTATPSRTVSVQGIGTAPVAQGASIAVSSAAYRQGMAAAVADGQNKAEFLVSKTGATLGAVQSIAEGGGFISCSSGPEGEYVEFTGEQPDFGSAPSMVGPVQAARGGAPAPIVRHTTAKKRKKSKTPAAKKATASGCTLTAQVALVYTID